MYHGLLFNEMSLNAIEVYKEVIKLLLNDDNNSAKLVLFSYRFIPQHFDRFCILLLFRFKYIRIISIEKHLSLISCQHVKFRLQTI